MEELEHTWIEYLDRLDIAFQPIVSIHSGQLYAVEALLRGVEEIGFNHDVFIRLRSCLSVFSLTIRPYPQISIISQLTTEFSVFINSCQAAFKTIRFDEMALVEGFVNNVDRWANTLFVSGGADLHFMDSSLRADMEMIKMLVAPRKITEEAVLGDIFDF